MEMSTCTSTFRAEAASISRLCMAGCRVGPWPTLTLSMDMVSQGSAPGISAWHTSKATAMSGRTSLAAVRAPREPTSSCTVAVNTTRQPRETFCSSSMATSMQATQARSSKVLKEMRLFIRRVKGTRKETGSPMRTKDSTFSLG